MDFLRDSGWQTVIGILGIIVAISIYRLQTNKKKLVCYVLTETPMLSVNDEIKEKIKIEYDEREIQNLYLVILRIENRGNVPITSSDFEEPITFSFPKSDVLNGDVIDSSPKNLKPVLDVGPDSLKLNRLLLNKRDFVTIKLIFSRYGNTIEIASRIIGLKDIEKIVTSARSVSSRTALFWLFLTGLTTFISALILGLILALPELRTTILYIIASLIVLLTLAEYFFAYMDLADPTSRKN